MYNALSAMWLDIASPGGLSYSVTDDDWNVSANIQIIYRIPELYIELVKTYIIILKQTVSTKVSHCWTAKIPYYSIFVSIATLYDITIT